MRWRLFVATVRNVQFEDQITFKRGCIYNGKQATAFPH